MKRRILILGGTGMLGHALVQQYLSRDDSDVYATIRSAEGAPKWLTAALKAKVQTGVDALNIDSVASAIAAVKPDVLINCIGLKPSSAGVDVHSLISINSLLPHRIARLCGEAAVRLIHISTDAVFDGKKGMYAERDSINISEVYGMSKFLGEISDPHCITLRTSIIGHELAERTGLLEWFLSQDSVVRGFTKAIYSGFPTLELARIIRDYVIPHEDLSGIFHVSSEPISKYDLLQLIAEQYGKRIAIEPCDDLAMNRSLDSSAFRSRTGYIPPSWPDMIHAMYLDYTQSRGNLYV
jgi:dTDP-4-dehydrorhamnose reductase